MREKETRQSNTDLIDSFWFIYLVWTGMGDLKQGKKLNLNPEPCIEAQISL